MNNIYTILNLRKQYTFEKMEIELKNDPTYTLS
jgi:hypothetical protein